MTLERVRIRDCACPGTPHAEEGDAVFLSPTLPAEGGIAAEQDMTDSGGDANALTRRWLLTFVRYGAKDWNLTEPFDVDVLLADWALARPVAIRAGELYQASVMAPFLPTPAKRSRTGRTPVTTSPTPLPIPSPSE